MGRILAGAIAVAFICGGLNWRSHIWITGERGSGKSYLMETIIARVLDGFSVAVQGETTEPGVRQALRSDVLPVLFDEIEGKGSEEDKRRVAKVLALARQASSANGAPIVKGSAGGVASHYRVRSSFFFASIEKTGTHAADESRIVTLTLKHPGPSETEEGRRTRAAAFDQLRDDVDRLITPEFGSRLFLRTLGMLDVINKNAETFAAAIAKMTGSRRLGDTLGQPLAGWLSLQTSSEISEETAAERLKLWTWLGGAIARGKTDADHDAAFAHLMQSPLRLDHGVQRSIGEMIEAVLDHTSEAYEGKFEGALNRNGVRLRRPDGDDVRTLMIVALNHPTLTELFRGQPFSMGTLTQMPGARAPRDPVRFKGFGKVRAIEIDISDLFEGGDRDSVPA